MISFSYIENETSANREIGKYVIPANEFVKKKLWIYFALQQTERILSVKIIMLNEKSLDLN